MVDPSVMLSEHVSVATFTKSPTAIRLGISNGLPDDMLERAQIYCENFFEKARVALGGEKVNIHSGWRSLELNNALPGSSKISDHMKANAMDFDCDDRMPLHEAFRTLLQSGIRWKQLMIEGVTEANPGGGWIHGAYNSDLPDEEQPMDIKVVRFYKDDNSGEVKPHYQEVTMDEALAWCTAREQAQS